MSDMSENITNIEPESASESRRTIDDAVGSEYKYGFVTDIDTEVIHR